MSREKTKKYILILLIAMTILLVAIVITMSNNKNKYETPNDEYIFPVTDETKIEQVNDYKQYFTVTNIIASYYGYVGRKDEVALRNVIDIEYLEKYSIKEELAKVESEEPIFYTNKIYVQTNDDKYIYYTYGKLKNYLDSTESQEVYLAVYLDDASNSFAIHPITREEYDNVISGKKLFTLKEIKNNEYNEFTYVAVSNMTKASTIFNNYKQIMSDDIEKAYNVLDEEYRKKNFKSVDEFKKFLNNREELKYSILKKFNITEKNNYTQYSCIDQSGNYYIFKETEIMQYKVMLDTYTIDLPEFKEEYKNFTEEQKIAVNIEKFIKAINEKKYYYAYNCLADSFKNNYFKTQEEFESYVKANFYNNNKIEYVNFEKQGELYTYRVSIKDQKTEKQLKKTFIMQLGKDTEFKLSFDR